MKKFNVLLTVVFMLVASTASAEASLDAVSSYSLNPQMHYSTGDFGPGLI